MYRIAFMTNRDRNLIGQDAYSQIKALLLELWSYPESSRFEINAQNFIQQRTGLSRSRIMQVLSELKAGNYIKNTAWKTVRASKPAGFILNGQASYIIKK